MKIITLLLLLVFLPALCSADVTPEQIVAYFVRLMDNMESYVEHPPSSAMTEEVVAYTNAAREKGLPECVALGCAFIAYFAAAPDIFLSPSVSKDAFKGAFPRALPYAETCNLCFTKNSCLYPPYSEAAYYLPLTSMLQYAYGLYQQDSAAVSWPVDFSTMIREGIRDAKRFRDYRTEGPK
jgi:hypothetical protein